MKNEIKSEFGERLKFFRKNILKMKRSEFCEHYVFPVITVQSWENNTSKISKRNIQILEQKLRDAGIAFDAQWLFTGAGQPWDLLKKEHEGAHTHNNTHANEWIYHVNSFCYEPLIKKDAKLTLEPIALHNINCPSFVALKDAQQMMHFGIILLTHNKQHVLQAYQGTFYTIVLHENDALFLIKKAELSS